MPGLTTYQSKCHILEIEMFPLLSGYSSACKRSGDWSLERDWISVPTYLLVCMSILV